MRGRPPKSKIRKRISSLLNHLNASYGYEVYKAYKTVFGPVKMRTVYYNLQKGVMLNEFMINDIKREVGNYTWGNETERVYYSNGPFAEMALLDEAQKIKLQKIEPKEKNQAKEEQTIRVIDEIKDSVQEFANEFKNYSVTQRKKRYEELETKVKKIKSWTKNPEQKQTIETIETQLKNYEY